MRSPLFLVSTLFDWYTPIVLKDVYLHSNQINSIKIPRRWSQNAGTCSYTLLLTWNLTLLHTVNTSSRAVQGAKSAVMLLHLSTLNNRCSWYKYMEWKPTDVAILFVYCWISTCFGPTGPSSGEFVQLLTQPLVQYLCRSVRVLCMLWPVLVTILETRE